MKDVFCVIMAGGAGTRFWPASRQNKPKQFIDILGTGKTFLRQTYERFLNVCEPENIFVVTHVNYTELVLEQIPELKPMQVLSEPSRKNTAPCIAYANYKISNINPNATIIVAPADHLILNEKQFCDDVIKGVEFCRENDVLLTMGIKPNRPETGYGYIQIDSKVSLDDNFFKVKTFTEKPNLEMAKVFVQSGEFFWNSGIFIWSLSTINHAFSTYLEDVDAHFAEHKDAMGTPNEALAIQKIYAEVKNISIDYGIMEKAPNVVVRCADFGWSDLGTWGSLYDNLPHNENNNAQKTDNILCKSTKNTLFDISPEKYALVYGLDGYVVAERDGMILICPKDNEKELREMVNELRMLKGDDFA